MAEKPPQSILLVDDDPDYCILLQEAFAGAGFRILQAGNGERALELLREESVDLVVSDFIMPELNGLELCRLVNDDLQLSKVKVVLYSGNTDLAFRKRARDLGALAYLPKTSDAMAMVRQICDLAGLGAAHPGANGQAKGDELLLSVSARTAQLKVLFDSLFDFIKIAALAESESPSVRAAWEAAQRSGGDIQRLLQQMGEEMEKLRA